MTRSKALKPGDHIFTSRYYAKALGLANHPTLFKVGLEIKKAVKSDDGEMQYQIDGWKWLSQREIDAWFSTSRVEPEEAQPKGCEPGYEP